MTKVKAEFFLPPKQFAQAVAKVLEAVPLQVAERQAREEAERTEWPSQGARDRLDRLRKDMEAYD